MGGQEGRQIGSGQSGIQGDKFRARTFYVLTIVPEQGAATQTPEHDGDHQDVVDGERDPERGERPTGQESQID